MTADDSTIHLSVGGTDVASYVDGSTVRDATLSPRPYLHPVRTLRGTVVTDAVPEDHRWHLGVSIAVQDVGGTNLWGGRTYVRDQGYVWREDHGSQRRHRWLEHRADGCREELGWYSGDGRCLLVETRSLGATRAVPATGTVPVTGAADASSGWVLTITSVLRNTSGGVLVIGSPATNGRTGAGYGGLFWRLPRPVGEPRVFTATEQGEAAVHGSLAPWLAWVARVADGTGPEAAFTVVLIGDHQDPWFVRVESYPGMGPALAFEHPLVLAHDQVLSRSFRALVVDGALDREAVVDHVEAMR